MNRTTPRGLRNHNPGNIRHSAECWQGEVRPSSDQAFKQFVSDAYGYRALLKLVSNYITRFGCTTLRHVITRWAPPSENNTPAYLSAVCRSTGIGADQFLKSDHEQQMCAVGAAISQHENGVPACTEDVHKGWQLLQQGI